MQQRLNIQSSTYRKLQLGEELKQIDKNIAAAKEAADALDKQMNELMKEVS